MSGPNEDDAVAWSLGRYTLYGEIAAGGMATVHIGRLTGAVGFAKLVAIKRMHPQFAKDEDFVAMFLDEARVATRIRHPNVVQMLDVLTEQGEMFIVMEYIHGDALSRLLRVLRAKREAVPPRIAISICAAALHGLHAAHEARNERGEPLGIIHRDVSPQNILVGTDGIARVIDFGVAKAAGQVHLTRDGEMKGKLVYMAPEQFAGDAVTRQSDIYAMAIVLWESLTGRLMFDSADSAITARARGHRPDPPSLTATDLPRAVDAIVLKGLDDTAANRWATAREMALALEDTVAMATPAQIGAWVEQVAERSLAERQARIDEIELRGADEIQSARELVDELRSERSVVSAARPASTARPAPPLPLAQRATRPPPSATPAPARAMPPRPLPPPMSLDPWALPPLPRDSGDATPELPQLPMSLAAPAIPTELAKPARTRVEESGGRGRGGLFALALLVAALAALVFWVPGLVKKNYVAAAAANGASLSIDDVELFADPGSIDLVGVTLSSGDLPGVSARAKRVQLKLDGKLDAKTLLIHDADVTIDASFAALQEGLDRLAARQSTNGRLHLPSTLAHAQLESMHLVWTQPFGAGTRAEAKGINLEMSQSAEAANGDNFALTPALVSITTPLGPVGPWVMDARRAEGKLKARVSFDAKAPQTAGLDVATAPGTAAVDLHLMHASAASLGLDPTLFGARPGDPVNLDIDLRARLESQKLDASIDLRVVGWRAAGGPPATFALSGTARGDISRPIDLGSARIALGGASAPLTGKLTAQLGGVALAGSAAAPVSCEGGAPLATVALVADSRDLARFGLGLSRGCGKNALK